MEKKYVLMRREIINLVWEKFKNKYFMQDLARVFKMDTGNFYRELIKGRKR